MRRRRLVPLITSVAAVATSALLAGCGLTPDAATEPGLAVKVDGLNLGLAKVDRVVDDYCALLAQDPQAQAAPRAFVRANFALGWARARAVDALAGEYGVQLPPSPVTRSVVEADFGRSGSVTDDNYDSLAWLSGLQQRLGPALEQLGTKVGQESGQAVAGEAALRAGNERVLSWLDDNDLVLNPAFGTFDEKTGGFGGGDLLSIPVSSEARANDDPLKLSAEQLAALPATQRCGPAAPAAPAAPVAPAPGG